MIPLATPRRTLIAALIALVTILGGMAALVHQDRRSEYRMHQKHFRQVITEQFGPDKAARVEGGIRQLWIPDLGVTDRCVTCHLGIGWEKLEAVALPLGNHSQPALMQKHPRDRFGCTPCHGGQGFATNAKDAHGWVKHWDDPRPPLDYAEIYQLEDRTGFLQSRCNHCHRYERDVAGMPLINHAKHLVDEHGCRDCHMINGQGGKVGPDLTWEGDREPLQMNFASISLSPKSIFNWHMEHFLYPQKVTPMSIMPRFRFSVEDRQALTLLVMSWKEKNYPLRYLPRDITPESSPRSDTAAAEQPRISR